MQSSISVESCLQGFLWIFLVFVVYTTWKIFRPRTKHSLRSVAILVLGDIGRSPRMMYHAQSFAENSFTTDIIGYGGSRPIPSLERLPRVRMRFIPELPKVLFHLPFLILAPIKVIHQIVVILLWLLVWIDIPPEFIVVQNPPSIPTLVLVQLVCRIHGSKVIIDWHNLGYSILALKLGPNHILVRIAKWFEATFGRQAYAHLFVTRAMRDFLVKEWDLQGKIVVLYDRPPRCFHRASTQEIHELFQKLQLPISAQNGLHDFLPKVAPPYSTLFTHTSTISPLLSADTLSPLNAYRAKIASPIGTPTFEAIPTYAEVRMPTLRDDRPALLVSSTSWTPDEDFSILIDALGIYELRAQELFAQPSHTLPATEGNLPKLLVIVTGKGPSRDRYMKRIERLQKEWKWVRCISLWLEAEDYPILLGSADLGVSLHSSSSALDLPMKVVDMFGCGLPVCALDFASLGELVKPKKNGLIFRNAAQLAVQLEDLLLSFPNAPGLIELTTSLAGVSSHSSTPSNIHSSRYSARDSEDLWTWVSWEDNWGRVVRPLILRDVNL